MKTTLFSKFAFALAAIMIVFVRQLPAQGNAVIPIYSQNFEGGIGPEWSHTNTSVTPVGARRFLGQLTNQTVTLTLTNLPPHAFARINFSLFIISSWDGNNTIYGPDRWTMQASNGPVLIDTTFSVVFSEDQAFPGSYGNGSFPAGTGAAETNTLGFPGFADRFGDTVYNPSPSLVHTSATLTISFTFAPKAGTYSGLPDDNWGLDDVSVELFDYGPEDLQSLYLSNVSTLFSNNTNGHQAVLFANYPSLTNLDVTTLASWSSSNPSVFTVDAAGHLFPQNPGDASLVASYQNLAATTAVSVAYAPPIVSHTVSTAVGYGADIEVREISGIGLDNSSLGSHPYANARYSTTSQSRNEVIALRFDLTGYDLAQIQNAKLNLTNYRDNGGTRVLHYYGVKAGAVGLDNNTNAYYYTNGLSPHYTAENWDESKGGPDGTNLLVFSTMPGLVFDGNINTRGFSATDLVDLGAQATSSNSKGTIATFTSSALISNLTVFLRNHSSPLVTILVGRDTDVTTQDRFASKEATALDGGTPTGATGDFAPRLVFDAPATAIPAALNIQLLGASVVLTWTNAGFQLQAAPTITSPFTNIPAATSPYTNPATGDHRYFRLKQ